MPAHIESHRGLVRPNYFDRQRLTADDLMAAQRHLLARRHLHNRHLHGWGITCGLDVRPANLPVAGAQIYYRYSGGNVNLAINGVTLNVQDFNILNGTTVGGVNVAVSAASATARIDRLTLTGQIASLSLGGQELLLFQIRTRETPIAPETSFMFNGLTLGAEYDVGDLITVEGLPLNVQSFAWSDGTVFSGGRASVIPFFSTFGVRVLSVNNVNLSFNFTRSCTVEIGAGYFVTPNGDEARVPERAVYDLSELIEACAPGESPCSDPSDLSEDDDVNVVEGIPARLLLSYRDQGGNSNLEINGDFRNIGSLSELAGQTVGGVAVTHEVIDDFTSQLQLDGPIRAFAVGGQEFILHSICPTYPDGTTPCLTFDDLTPGQQFFVGDSFESGGFMAEMRRFQFSNGEYFEGGNFSVTESGAFLNNINLALTFTVGTNVYLIARYREVDICPTPAVPGDCQPISEVFYARVCETYAIDVICELPPLHQPDADCEAAEALFCGTGIVPCPPDPGEAGDYVVLARIIVDRARAWDSSVIDTSIRRRLLSDELVQAMLRCRCQSERQRGTITGVTIGESEVILRERDRATATEVAIHGAGLNGAVWVRVEGEAMFMIGSPSHATDNTLLVRMTVLPTPIPNFAANLSFSIYFDDGRPPLHSASFGVFLPVRARTSRIPPPIRPDRDRVIVIDNAVREPVENMDRIGRIRARRLAAAGIHTAYDLLGRSPAEIARIAGMSEDEAKTAYRSAIERARRPIGDG